MERVANEASNVNADSRCSCEPRGLDPSAVIESRCVRTLTDHKIIRVGMRSQTRKRRDHLARRYARYAYARTRQDFVEPRTRRRRGLWIRDILGCRPDEQIAVNRCANIVRCT